MKAQLREHGAETLIGLLVVLLAAWFVLFAWQRTGGGSTGDTILVNADFQSATGVSVGTVVRIAGIKVGQVSAVKLDPKSYQAEVTLALDPRIRVPSDSSAAISSEGLLGNTYLGLIPGGSTTPLKNGDTIVDTQGSVDLMSMVGQFINKSGGGSASAGNSGAPTSPAASPNP